MQRNVATSRLPQLIRGRRDVQDIVGDLERETDGGAVLGERPSARRGCCGQVLASGTPCRQREGRDCHLLARSNRNIVKRHVSAATRCQKDGP